MLKILFVGSALHGSTTQHRISALNDLGHSVLVINSWKYTPQWHPRSVIERAVWLSYRCGSPLAPRVSDSALANEQMIAAVRSTNWDIVWIEKGLSIEAETLDLIRRTRRGVRIVGFSPDDMLGRHNHSAQFLQGLHLYDVFFTTKKYNVLELKNLGCPEVVFVDNAYDPKTHKPVLLAQSERVLLGGDVGFIGTYEKQRAESMNFLSQRGVPVRIYGSNWRGSVRWRYPHLTFEGKSPVADDYARVICSFKVNLNFLRKMNRDQQTTRSIEIPACGKLMIAERTQEHMALFDDGKEAVFFDSNEELFDWIRYFLKHPDHAEKIGHAGLERCVRGGYSNRHRLQFMINTVLGM